MVWCGRRLDSTLLYLDPCEMNIAVAKSLLRTYDSAHRRARWRALGRYSLRGSAKRARGAPIVCLLEEWVSVGVVPRSVACELARRLGRAQFGVVALVFDDAEGLFRKTFAGAGLVASRKMIDDFANAVASCWPEK